MFGKKEERIPEERRLEIFNRIKPIIAKELDIDENKVTLTASFVDDLGADSLDSIEIIMALEEEFSIEILDEDAEKIKTIDDVVSYLATRIE